MSSHVLKKRDRGLVAFVVSLDPSIDTPVYFASNRRSEVDPGVATATIN